MTLLETSTELDAQLEGGPRLYSDIAPAPSSRTARPHRVTALRPSSVPHSLDERHEGVILDLLLAAAHADGAMCGREKRTVTRIMLRLTGGYELPHALEQRIEAFDPNEFDAREAAEMLLESRSPAPRVRPPRSTKWCSA